MGIDIKKIVFLFLIVVLSSLVYGVECGDTITSDYVLEKDLIDCSNGLYIGNNSITLDCNGHTISGKSSGSGIRLGHDDIEIRNCIFKNFRYDIYIFDGTNIKIENNIFMDSNYAIISTYSGSSNLNIFYNKFINGSEIRFSWQTSYLVQFNEFYNSSVFSGEQCWGETYHNNFFDTTYSFEGHIGPRIRWNYYSQYNEESEGCFDINLDNFCDEDYKACVSYYGCRVDDYPRVVPLIINNCFNDIKDGIETDIDCGGGCSRCNNGWGCNLDSDCQSNLCGQNNICLAPVCNDGIMNGDETGVDCGGSCYYSCVVPVMLVQGFLSDPEIDWASIKSWLEEDGYVVDAVDLTIQTGFASGDIKEYAKWLRTRIRYEKTANRAEKVDVIGYDMGGLVARWYVNVLDGPDVRNIYLIGTPNHGTEYFWVDKGVFFVLDKLAAKLGLPGKLIIDMIKHIRGEASKQMMPHSDFLNELNYGNPEKDYGTDYLAPIGGYVNIAGDKSAIVHNYLGQEVQNNFLKKPHDNFVTVKSVGLDNVGLSIYHLNHSELTRSQEVYNQIKDALSSGITFTSELAMSAVSEPEIDFHMAPLISGELDVEDKIYYAYIDNSVIEAQFILGHFISNISLSLTMPDGFIINPETIDDNPNNAFIDSMFLTGYHIDNPQVGKWKINISLRDFEEEKINFSLYIFLKTNISLDVNISKYHYDLNEQINLTAELKEGFDYITGANVTVKIKKPDETIENLSLYDDGTHNDLMANDGIYNNIYTDTDMYGRYYISVIANGKNFSREKFTSVWVEDYPDLIVKDISFLKSTFFIGDNVTIHALIENIGEKEALNATIEFYHSTEYEDEFIGEKNISVEVGETKEIFVDWMNLSLGNYNVTVLISPFNSFLEKNYSNNLADKSILVLEPPNGLLLNEGWNLFSLIINSTGIDQNISLKKGWNLMGYSGFESFNWSRARVYDGNVTMPIADAHERGLLQFTIYYYEDGIYKFVPEMNCCLISGKGYWLYAFRDLTLILPGVGGVLNKELYWMNATVYDGTELIPAIDAQSLGWLQATLYYFDEDFQYYKFVPGNDDYAYPWRGYWLYSNEEFGLVLD